MEAEEAAGGGERKRKRDGDAVRDDEEEEEEEEGVYEGIAEESVAELMRWLEMEISDAAPETETKTETESGDDPAGAAAPGFVTINGNEESCGPSFSAAASTVMASVDTRAGAPPAPPVPWPLPPAADVVPAEVVVDGVGEEWLVELLTSGPAVA
ncbi:uncharacterized protein LOC127760236 [Oryza glaberrima]|uniref:Uncharacterized protein n=2 Tax=Oryza TaxID=4527 RepID=A0A0D3EKM5_9ORYZ|nr:uncharacterized protein LOC127760236 [Oryza glaberrima]